MGNPFIFLLLLNSRGGNQFADVRSGTLQVGIWGGVWNLIGSGRVPPCAGGGVLLSDCSWLLLSVAGCCSVCSFVFSGGLSLIVRSRFLNFSLTASRILHLACLGGSALRCFPLRHGRAVFCSFFSLLTVLYSFHQGFLGHHPFIPLDNFLDCILQFSAGEILLQFFQSCHRFNRRGRGFDPENVDPNLLLCGGRRCVGICGAKRLRNLSRRAASGCYDWMVGRLARDRI